MADVVVDVSARARDDFAAALAAADRFRSPVLHRWIATRRDRRLEGVDGTALRPPIGA